MSEDTSAYTVTLKGGKGYEDSWIVVRGDSVADVAAKLQGIGEVVGATVAAASLFHGANAAGPIVQPPPAAPIQQVAEQLVAAQQAAPGWATAPPAQAAAPQQQFAPQTQAATGPRGERLHPEGRTCAVCPNPLMEKKSSNGKLKWQCSEWRWNGGNPNQHTAEFQN